MWCSLLTLWWSHTFIAICAWYSFQSCGRTELWSWSTRSSWSEGIGKVCAKKDIYPAENLDAFVSLCKLSMYLFPVSFCSVSNMWNTEYANCCRIVINHEHGIAVAEIGHMLESERPHESSLSAIVESGVRVAIPAPAGRITRLLPRRVPSGPRLWEEPWEESEGPCRVM